MEKSLDELIEFLLGEIAACGAKGELFASNFSRESIASQRL
jgi:hypothetical protein